MIYKHMDYIPFDINNPNCLHVFMSNRAYSAIISEALSHGGDETGGLLIGSIVGRTWYIVDMIDPGTDTIHETGLFRWEQDYVNKSAARMRNLYRIPPTILGFWHRHPGSMDFFSQQDVESTQKNLQGARKGLISMLVNIDPALRMTFYYCNGPHFMPVRFDVGDEYFPVELLEYASPELLAQRHASAQGGRPVAIHYQRVLQPRGVPGMAQRKSVRAVNDQPIERSDETVTPALQETPEKPQTKVPTKSTPEERPPQEETKEEVDPTEENPTAEETGAEADPAAENPAAEETGAEADPAAENPTAEETEAEADTTAENPAEDELAEAARNTEPEHLAEDAADVKKKRWSDLGSVRLFIRFLRYKKEEQ